MSTPIEKAATARYHLSCVVDAVQLAARGEETWCGALATLVVAENTIRILRAHVRKLATAERRGHGGTGPRPTTTR